MSTAPNTPQPGGQRPPQTPPPPVTALALPDNTPEWLKGPLAQYASNPRYELLLPAIPISSELQKHHRVNVSLVRLSANPNDKEVFEVAAGKYAYTKAGLEKLADAAGIHINTKRIDDRKDPEYCEFKATGAMRNSSGQPIIRTATKSFYMPHVAATSTPREVPQFRRHLVARTETGAILRVIRSLLAIKSGLSKEQVERPKILVRIDFQPDASDPAANKFLLEQGAHATDVIFGAERSSAHVVEEVEAEVIPDDPETVAARSRTEPAVVVESDEQEALPTGELQLTEPDYEGMVFEACAGLGISAAERKVLFAKHKGDAKAVYAELNERADRAAS